VNWDEMAVVGRIARPHGIRGQVVINLETDFPDERFQPGAEFFVQRAAGRAGVVGDGLQAVLERPQGRSLQQPGIGRLVIATVRFHNGRPVVGFEGVEDMNQARALAGIELRVPLDRLASLPPEMFYRHDLVGCSVETTNGLHVGEVTEVEGTLGGSRLVVATPRGDVLVPLAAEICRAIDVAGKRIVIEPPEGLLELNQK
jgi:16S rRNA processing protein RimM